MQAAVKIISSRPSNVVVDPPTSTTLYTAPHLFSRPIAHGNAFGAVRKRLVSGLVVYLMRGRED